MTGTTVKPLGLLTVDDVAVMLEVSRRTIQRLPIPYAKVGRRRVYLLENVMAYLQKKAS